MSAAGLPPGPRAVHAAVVAAARAGDADGALDAMRAAHAQGERRERDRERERDDDEGRQTTTINVF
jgi:DNA-binding GntR family transcriptional regulator